MAEWFLTEDSTSLGWDYLGVPVLAYIDNENDFTIGIYKEKGSEKYTIEIDGDETSDGFDTLRRPTAKAVLRDPSFEFATGLDGLNVDIPEIPKDLLDEIKTVKKGLFDIVTKPDTFAPAFPYFEEHQPRFTLDSNGSDIPALEAIFTGKIDSDTWNVKLVSIGSDLINEDMTSDEFYDFCKEYTEDESNFVENFIERYEEQPAIEYFFGLDVNGSLDKIEPTVERTGDDVLTAEIVLTDAMLESDLHARLYLNEETDDITGEVFIIDEGGSQEYTKDFEDLRMMRDVISSFLDLRDPYNGKFVMNKLLKALR